MLVKTDFISKALEKKNLLTFEEFFKVTECSFEVNVWNTIYNDLYVYVDGKLIRWFGYEAAEGKNRKTNFVRSLKNISLEEGEYFIYSNNEYSEFLKSIDKQYTTFYPPVDLSNGKNNTKHILLSPDCLKKVIMKLSTKKASEVREEFKNIEMIFEAYKEYMKQYEKLKVEKEENEKRLNKLNSSLESQKLSKYTIQALEKRELLTLEEFINVTNYSIDKLYIDKFWNTMNSDLYVYVDDELIRWFGYEAEESRHRKNLFTRFLKNTALEEGEYFIYSNDEYSSYLENLEREKVVSHICDTTFYPPVDLSHGKNNTKHILLSPDCLKKVLMCLDTKKAKQVRTYYIELEKLFKVYLEYQTVFRNIQREEETQKLLLLKEEEKQKAEEEKKKVHEELQKAEAEKEKAEEEKQEVQKQLEEKEAYIQRQNQTNEYLKEFVSNIKAKELSEFLYIATTNTLSSKHKYKVGGSSTLKTLTARLSTYNSGHSTEDPFKYVNIYRCSNYRQAEERIKSILGDYRESKDKEIYIVNYASLNKVISTVIDHYNNEIELSNEILSELLQDLMTVNTVKIPEINLQKFIEENEPSKNCFPNPSSLSNEELISLLKSCISEYAERFYNIKNYDFTKSITILLPKLHPIIISHLNTDTKTYKREEWKKIITTLNWPEKDCLKFKYKTTS